MRNPVRGVAFGLALVLVGVGSGVRSQVAPIPDPGAHRISVDVDLVVLHPTVRDRKGRFISGLRAQDFAVFEDDVRQAIRLFRHEDIPVTVGLVIDHSGSMGPKLADVTAAARTFVRSSNPEDEMFVVNFNEKVTLGLPGAIRFSNRLDELESAILKTRTAGQTALYDAVAEALDRLQTGGREKKALIVISDGADNASAIGLPEALTNVQQSSALVYTVGIFDEDDPDRNPGVLRRLAAASGGEAFFPGQLDDVVSICERIAHDIRNQYTIGYFSTNAAQTGAYRRIRMTAAMPGEGKLRVRTRSGYIESRPARNPTAQ